MAARIEIDIGVKNGGAFDAFAQKFKAYTEKLDATPGAWANVSRSSEESTVRFQALAAAVVDQAEAIAKITSSSTTLRLDSEATARHWHGLSNSTRAVAGNIKEATAAILKWTGVTAVVAGVTGGIGAFGFDRLADGVASSRTASMGLGASYGGRASFLANFRAMGDPEGFLSRVNEAQHDVSKNVALRSIGLSEEQSRGDSADVAANTILQLKKLVDGVKDPKMLADRLRAVRADQLVSLNEAELLRSVKPEEVEQWVANYRKSKPRLKLEDGTQKAYQDFVTRMAAATSKINNTFVKNLGELTPGMTRLATSFSHLVDVLMQKDGPLSHWLEKLDEGVEWLAKNIDSPEFLSKVQSFVAEIGEVAKAVGSLLTGIVSFAKWFGITPAEASTGATGSGAFGVGTGLRARNSAGGARDMGGGGSSGGASGGGSGGGGGFMDALARIESGNQNIFSRVDPDKYGPGTRSQGYFQIETGTWRQFAREAGVDLRQYPNAMDAPREVQERVARLIPLKRFGPRTQSMLRGQFGPLNGSAPVGQLGPQAPANTTTRVTITKPTGADPSTAAAATAGQ